MPNEASTAGKDLAKVLWHYGLVGNIVSESEKIICPFHNDINPSMIVNMDEGSWYCFGCSLSGNAAKFVRYMEKNLDDVRSYLKYLRILKSDEVGSVAITHVQKASKATLKEQYSQAYDYYHGLAKVSWDDPDGVEAIAAKEYMLRRGFTSKALTLCNAKVTYNKSYGIIFPMTDNGIFKGWVCRTMLKEVEAKRKYLYNEGFRRRSTLVGSYAGENTVYIVEGYMDRLKFLQNGINNVVAILGWKISQQQISKLKEAGIECIVSALDNDECGKKGTVYLRKFFKVTRFAYLKGVKDPGDMSAVQFKKSLQRTKDKQNESGE